jgi:hypothetical protein
MRKKKAISKNIPKKKPQKEASITIPEHEFKNIFDYALERMREISKKYEIKTERP